MTSRKNVSLENISSQLELVIFSLSLYTQKLRCNQVFELGQKREVDIVKFTTTRSLLVLDNIFPKKDVDWSNNYLSSAVLTAIKSVVEKKTMANICFYVHFNYLEWCRFVKNRFFLVQTRNYILTVKQKFSDFSLLRSLRYKIRIFDTYVQKQWVKKKKGAGVGQVRVYGWRL